MKKVYVHGYDVKEALRLQDQASTLVELLHSDTSYPAGSRVLEAGCGVGAQTIPLSRNSPGALITSVDIAAASVAEAKQRASSAGLKNVRFEQADIFNLPYRSESFDHVFVCFVLEHLSRPTEALNILKRHLLLYVLQGARRQAGKIVGFDLEGFLSDDISIFVKQFAHRNKDIVDLALELNRFAQRTMLSFHAHSKHVQELVAASLLIRCMSHYQTTVILCKHGLIPEAKIVARSLMEAMFILVATSKEYRLAMEYAQDDLLRARGNPVAEVLAPTTVRFAGGHAHTGAYELRPIA